MHAGYQVRLFSEIEDSCSWYARGGRWTGDVGSIPWVGPLDLDCDPWVGMDVSWTVCLDSHLCIIRFYDADCCWKSPEKSLRIQNEPQSYGHPPPSYHDTIYDLPPEYSSLLAPLAQRRDSFHNSAPSRTEKTSPSKCALVIDLGSPAGIREHKGGKKKNAKKPVSSAPLQSSPPDDGGDGAQPPDEEQNGGAGGGGGDDGAGGGGDDGGDDLGMTATERKKFKKKKKEEEEERLAKEEEGKKIREEEEERKAEEEKKAAEEAAAKAKEKEEESGDGSWASFAGFGKKNKKEKVRH